MPIGIAEDVGDLGERQAVEVLEDEDRPLVGRQPAEAALQLVAVGDPPERVRLVPADRVGVGVVGEQPDDRPAAPLAAGLRDAGPDDDPVRPGVETVRVAQPRQLVPDRDQRLLQRILGEVVVAQDPVGGREQAAGRQAHQRLEGLLVATRRSRYEVTLHALPSPAGSVATRMGRSRSMGSRAGHLFNLGRIRPRHGSVSHPAAFGFTVLRRISGSRPMIISVLSSVTNRRWTRTRRLSSSRSARSRWPAGGFVVFQAGRRPLDPIPAPPHA